MKKAPFCTLLTLTLVFAALILSQAAAAQGDPSFLQRIFDMFSTPDGFTQPVQFGSFTVYIPEDFSFTDDENGPAYAGSLSDSCEATVLFADYVMTDADLYEIHQYNSDMLNSFYQDTRRIALNMLHKDEAEAIIYKTVQADECVGLRISLRAEMFPENRYPGADVSYEALIIVNHHEVLYILVQTSGDGHGHAATRLTDGILEHIVAPKASLVSVDTDTNSMTQTRGHFTITLPDGTQTSYGAENAFRHGKTEIKFINYYEDGASTPEKNIMFCYSATKAFLSKSTVQISQTSPFTTFKMLSREDNAICLILCYREQKLMIAIISPDYDDALDVADAILDSVVFSGGEGASDETGVWDDFIPAP